MSLLMDALKRAEEAKRQAAAGAQPAAPAAPPAAPPELSLDPLDAPAAVPGRSLPPLSRHLDAVDADLAAGVGGPLPRRGRTAAAAEGGDRGADDAARTAVKNVFAVKQEPRPRTSLWLFVGLGGAAALAIAGYFWWQLQGLAGGSRVTPPPAVAVVQPPVVPATASPPPVVPPSPAAITAPPAPPPVPAAGSSLSPQAVPGPAAPPAAAPRERRQRDERAGNLPADDAGVVRSASRRPQAERTLDRAYEDWQAGRLDEARSAYEQALRSDPRNADALLGLAAIALRQGQLERAQNLYLRVLESDPADATAQAALINLHGGGDGGQSESRLKTLLAAQPDSPPLHFALGNLYSRQRRWSDAQQAYFQAYALDPDNPDYLFNVAVSLDHLRQGKLALQYYRMALNAADLSRAAFDRNAARQRILELQP